eukprot:TRINITY_DN29166_c0_g2_i1.p1 TRINITY_DN29166_c0_g2~~TRINITY_DN29166_c0_g2_i1.p1  ORF type:complete len:463 (-),score=42.15 TRINITY_DN29166_c0_g2_i1:83-1471(-)
MSKAAACCALSPLGDESSLSPLDMPEDPSGSSTSPSPSPLLVQPKGHGCPPTVGLGGSSAAHSPGAPAANRSLSLSPFTGVQDLSPLSPPCSSVCSPSRRPPRPRGEASPARHGGFASCSPLSPLGLGAMFGASVLAASESSPSLHWTASPAARQSPKAERRSGEKQMWTLDDFEVGQQLGAGNFGHVHLVRERASKAVAALKVMQKRRIERMHAQRHVTHEINIQGHLRHAGVLRLFGFFWDAKKLYLLLEHAPGGNLQDLLSKQPERRFSETEAAGHTRQVADALAYLHRTHVIHRDVKPLNILVGLHGRLKLADFGWAVHMLPGDRRWTLCGTLDYLPPEMVHATRGHGFGVDVWALGILTYALLYGEPPFTARMPQETYRRILDASPEFPDLGSPTPPGQRAQEFIRHLLQCDQDVRPAMETVVAHGWLQHHYSQLCVPGAGCHRGSMPAAQAAMRGA